MAAYESLLPGRAHPDQQYVGATRIDARHRFLTNLKTWGGSDDPNARIAYAKRGRGLLRDTLDRAEEKQRKIVANRQAAEIMDPVSSGHPFWDVHTEQAGSEANAGPVAVHDIRTVENLPEVGMTPRKVHTVDIHVEDADALSRADGISDKPKELV
jgi:hypothetical protein